MNERVARLKERLKVEQYPICVEKSMLVMESYRQTEGEPTIIRRAKATAHYLEHKTIFIEDDELIVGNVAEKQMGMEAGSLGPTWPKEELEELRQGGLALSQEDENKLRAMDEYWLGKGRTLWERMALYYDDERLWPFIQSGILLPPWEKKTEGRGHGAAGVGWGLGVGLTLVVVDFEKVLRYGLDRLLAEAAEELRNIRYTDAEQIKKADFLHAVIIANKGMIRLAQRFADLAEKMAAEEKSVVRKKELLGIAEICRHVPAKPARSFYEAIQVFWFVWMAIASGTAAGGRFDQFMYPYLKKDKEEVRIDDTGALELLECLRIKIMQYNFLGGNKLQRDKWAGMARWNNIVVGGLTPDGRDATNELSYLLLRSAMECQTPHPTITVRVHAGTPLPFLQEALALVRTGIGMPAFVGDNSYIDYLLSHGVPLAEARDYSLGGCLDAMLAGKSRTSAIGMFIVPRVLEIAMNNGIDPRSGRQLGPQTGEFSSFETYEDFLRALKEQLAHFMGLTAEEHNILLQAQRDLYPDPIHSLLMYDAIREGKDLLDRALPFENGSVLNPVGMVNVADSLAAIKKLVFEEEMIDKEDMQNALAANWHGYEHLRKLCLAAPKYGNGDTYADEICRDLYNYWSDTAGTFYSIYGAKVKASGISITAHGPGGATTGATPDGRYAGDNLADGTVSAAQGRDVNGPTALLRSAMTINQQPYQSTLLNMKFHPSALHSDADLEKLAVLIKTYFECGGKHIQFNVVDRETLMKAQVQPQSYRDLVVRVAGYSAYFVQLTRAVQDDIISRTEYRH